MNAPIKPPVRVLVVDDSAAMRALLGRILGQDPELEVVGSAPEVNSARAMIKELSPDVVTLDVEMPGMDGLSFLERIMRLRPMPVVMCSSLTARGAHATIEALRLGAVDCIAKPEGNPLAIAGHADHIRATVKAAGRSRARNPSAGPVRPIASTGGYRDTLIAIGASTGGVEALFTLVPALPADCPPVLIVQHMPESFTASFAGRLDAAAAIRVVEAEDGTPLEPGTAYIAPGGACHMELASGTVPRISLRPGELVGGHRPSVDTLFGSAARRGGDAVGVILTGMGHDGADGLLAMRRAGARTFGQSADSCVIHGMPRAAAEAGAVERQVHLTGMAEAILRACRNEKA